MGDPAAPPVALRELEPHEVDSRIQQFPRAVGSISTTSTCGGDKGQLLLLQWLRAGVAEASIEDVRTANQLASTRL